MQRENDKWRSQEEMEKETGIEKMREQKLGFQWSYYCIVQFKKGGLNTRLILYNFKPTIRLNNIRQEMQRLHRIPAEFVFIYFVILLIEPGIDSFGSCL